MLITILYSMAVIVVGGFFLVLALFAIWRGVRLTIKGVHVEGRVVDYYVDPNSEGGGYPVVEFFDQEGTLRRVKLGLATSWDPAVGQPMSLVYDPDDPNVVSCSSAFAIWIVPMILGIFGVMAVFMGVGVLTLAN
jgi:hypothetical protein